MDRTEKAKEIFKGGFNCSQTVFASFSEELGLDREKALKIACGFGAGMARMSETCGAVTGAFMAIGLKYGKTAVEDNASRDKTYALIQEFVRRFKEKNRTIVCKELMGCDLSTPDGSKEAADKRLFVTLCPNLVGDAVRILEEIL